MDHSTEDRGTAAFVRLLKEGHEDDGARRDALSALQRRSVWLATWEPRAKGFRTLINSAGEEALAVFSSERELNNAASRFGWLEPDGSIATHGTTGAEILRHAWTHEYPFLVVDIAADHSVEFGRNELRFAVEHDEVSGQYISSRAPKRSSKSPQAKAGEILEVSVAPPQLGAGGTYGAASIIPPKRASAPAADPMINIQLDLPAPESVAQTPDQQLAGHSPTSGQQAVNVAEKSEPANHAPDGDTASNVATSTSPQLAPASDKDPGQTAPKKRSAARSLGSIAQVGTELSEVDNPPSDEVLGDFAAVLRDYPEVEWAAFCSVARLGGGVSPAIGLRVDESYRTNVTEIAQKLVDVGQGHHLDLDVLLIDDMELLRKARAMALVFFPWMPKRG